MSLPEIEVAKMLKANQKLMALMSNLRSAKLDYDPVFTETPKDEFIKASSAPWIRVTPIPGDSAIYSDNTRLFEYHRVQVDFWIRRTQMKYIEELQNMIYETLHEQEYERYYLDRYSDPDLDNCLMVTANFEGFEERND